MAVGLGHSLRAGFALGSLVVALALAAVSTLGADPASAAPTPLPPVLKPPTVPHPVKPPFAPPKESKGPLKPYVPPSNPPKSLLPKTPISPAEKKAVEKEEAKEKEEEELKKDKGHGACRHGFGSSITNKLSVSCMTEQAVDKIFGLPDGFGTQKLLRGLLKVPDFVSDSSSEGVGDAERLTQAIAFALLMAAVTFTLFHYFAAGMMSGGGSGMFVDGVTRCVGAALMILAWPFLFENAANITNVITNILIPASSIDGGVGMLANAAEAGGTLGAGLLVMIVFAVLMLVLLMVKIGLLTGLMIAFVGTPLALALWPIPSLSGPATYALRFVGMVLTVMILWAVCLRIFGAVNLEFRQWGGRNLGVGGKLLLPLVGLGSLLALLSIPRHAVQMWNVAPQKGTVGSMFQYAASNVIAGSVRGGGKQAAASRKAGGGQARPGGGGGAGGGTRPGGGTAGPGVPSAAAGGGGDGGGSARGTGPAPAVAAAAQAGGAQARGAGTATGASQASRRGSGGGGNQRRGGSAPAPAKGKSGGGGGNSRQQPGRRRGQGSSAKPAGGQGAGRAPGAGGGRTEPASRPQGAASGGGGGGSSSSNNGGTGGGSGGRTAGTSSPARGTRKGSGAKPAPPTPRRPDPGTGGPPPSGSGKPPRPGPTSHQNPPPPSR